MSSAKYIEAKKILEKYNQSHVLAFYDELDEESTVILLAQILSINFELMKRLYEHRNDIPVDLGRDKFEPIESEILAEMPPERIEKLRAIGLAELKKGGLAVVTMAGGQGTRLGHDGPKGTYDIGLPSGKSLFELQCDQLKESREVTGVSIPWYIMTSTENNDATIKFFEEHDYFGYGRDNVVFFTQSMLPMLDEEGKLILADKGSIKEGADGHGGVFGSLKRKGCLDRMTKQGINWVFICGVDNCLMKLADPIFLGFAIESGCKAASKPVLKRDPYEKAGVFCRKNGRPYVIEYTEISDEMANLKDDKGNYVYGDAHILGNIFRLDFLKEIADVGLPYHTAFKKAPYIDADGNLVKPENPNAYKFEMFLFDAFAFLDDMALLRVKREDEFAPVKNKTGEDSPETARELYLQYQQRKMEGKTY